MENEQKKTKKAITIFLAIFVFFMALSCWYIKAGIDAHNAGANSEQIKTFLTTHLPWQWSKVLDVTPDPHEDQILKGPQPEETPALYIVYRFECPDCEKAYPYIKEHIQNLTPEEQKNVWWVPSRTEAGKKFLELHPIQLVPSAVLRLDSDAKIIVLYDDATKETDKDMIDEVFKTYKENLKE